MQRTHKYTVFALGLVILVVVGLVIIQLLGEKNPLARRLAPGAPTSTPTLKPAVTFMLNTPQSRVTPPTNGIAGKRISHIKTVLRLCRTS